MEHGDEYSDFVDKVFQEATKVGKDFGPGVIPRDGEWAALDGPRYSDRPALVGDLIGFVFEGLSTSPVIDAALWRDRESGQEMVFFHHSWQGGAQDFYGCFFLDVESNDLVCVKLDSLVYDVSPTTDQVNLFLANCHAADFNSFLDSPPGWAFAIESKVVQLGPHGLLMWRLRPENEWSKLQILHWAFTRIFPSSDYCYTPGLTDSIGGMNPIIIQFERDFFNREYIRGFPVYLPFECRDPDKPGSVYDPAEGRAINRGSYEPALADWDGKPYSELGAFQLGYDMDRSEGEVDT